MAANPYVQGWREWDERYADLVIGKRNWQIAAGGLLLATIILAAGMVWLSGRTRYIVYAVEVDKLGYALTEAQPLTASSPPDVVDRIQRYEAASFIRRARSVSSDPRESVERSLLSGCDEPHSLIIGQPPRLLPRTRSTSPEGVPPERRLFLTDLRLKTLTLAYKVL